MKPLFPVALALLVAGCAMSPPPRPGLLDVVERPAEQALLAGLRAYEDAQYADAEKQFSLALKLGLPSPKDRAAADKHLAFIYCTTNRVAECEAAFRSARQADPKFSLSKSEAGHPLWGPVYQRVVP